MTREEAIKLLHEISDQCCETANILCTEDADKRCDALDMAIEALSQPIVVKCYEIDNDRVYCSPEMADKIYRALHEDTNVQNMHRGEWIDKEIPCNPYPPVFCVECSECGYRVGRETFQENTFNYCPNCGARMGVE